MGDMQISGGNFSSYAFSEYFFRNLQYSIVENF